MNPDNLSHVMTAGAAASGAVSPSQSPAQSLPRRSLTRAAAWSVPAVAVAAAAPTLAASPCVPAEVAESMTGTIPYGDGWDVLREKDSSIEANGFDLSIDGWGKGGTAGTMRIFFGTKVALTSVVLTLTIPKEPEDFVLTGWNTKQSPSHMALTGASPFTQAVEVLNDPELTDAWTVTWVVGDMPELSSVTVNVPWTNPTAEPFSPGTTTKPAHQFTATLTLGAYRPC